VSQAAVAICASVGSFLGVALSRGVSFGHGPIFWCGFLLAAAVFVTAMVFFFTRLNPIKSEPNQALQHNDPSCHESCLRTPRASRDRG